MPQQEAITTVVNRKTVRGLRPDDVYIGRAGFGFEDRGFGNPFRIGPEADGDRVEVLAKYRAWFYQRLRTDFAFRRKVLELRGKRLVCWCKPKVCHGDEIASWLNGIQLVLAIGGEGYSGKVYVGPLENAPDPPLYWCEQNSMGGDEPGDPIPETEYSDPSHDLVSVLPSFWPNCVPCECPPLARRVLLAAYEALPPETFRSDAIGAMYRDDWRAILTTGRRPWDADVESRSEPK